MVFLGKIMGGVGGFLRRQNRDHYSKIRLLSVADEGITTIKSSANNCIGRVESDAAFTLLIFIE